MKKLDIHTHLFAPSIIADRNKYCRKDPSFSLLYSNPKSRMVTAEQMITAMDEDGVLLSGACAFPWRDTEAAAENNDYLIESSEKYPDRIAAFICPPLTSPRDVNKELGRLQGKSFKGFGELAFYQSGWGPATRSVLEPILEMAQSLNLPVLIHLNEPVGHKYPGKVKLDLMAVYEMVSLHPNVVFIMGHFGGGLIFYELMPEVKDTLKNVYYDTAAGVFLYSPQIYRTCFDIAGDHKLLYGSDFPLVRTPRYLKDIEAAFLTETEKEKLLYDNSAKILNLP